MKRFFILCMLIPLALVAGHKHSKIYYSPDKKLAAQVTTIDEKGNGGESTIEIRKPNGVLIGIKNFFSKDHEHGLAVLKAKWTDDSQYFVFSTVSSGGQQPGHFPTFVFSRVKNKIFMLDPLVGIWVTNPEFALLANDTIYVTVRDKMSNGEFADTLSKMLYLGKVNE